MKITLYDIALRFVGTNEVPGKRDNPQILAMLKLDDVWPEHDEIPWCAAFINYCAWLLRLPRSKKLTARSWLDVGRPVDLDEAEPGWDVVVFWRGSHGGAYGHVGLFAGVDGDNVLVLGGNQGDRVCISPYPVERLLGVRRLYLGCTED